MKELSIWEKAMGWRKRQMVIEQLEEDPWVLSTQRNLVIEEVASS